MRAQDYQISAEKFVFRTTEASLHDAKLETKPVSYFRDALNRFCKNKASIVAAGIIALLVLFAIIAPMFSQYTVAYEDAYYAYCRPRNKVLYNLGVSFWDGGTKKEVNETVYNYYTAIEQELGRPVIMGDVEREESEYMGKTRILYRFRLDTYNAVGAEFVTLTDAQYKALQAYQDEHKVQIILPITDVNKRPTATQDVTDANYWYETKTVGGKTEAAYASKTDKTLVPIYVPNDGTDAYTSTMYFEGDTKLYNYGEAMDNGTNWNVRVDYYEYYIYKHAIAGDGITEPNFIFGANNAGKDIFTCLASGARFSFILAVIVSSVNLFVGAIYGAIEGYYGGKIDLMMERFVDILASIPFMIVITLLKYHFNVSHVLILFISFFLTGWTGMAGRTRMQFYRFKNQEYVLVARTLGANDRRIMFKHIFPNALGTLITGSVLVIPGVIFSETSLSYLGIINLTTGNLTSVGTLLATGQNYLFTYPHMIVFPSIFISLLMLSFNLFGNGLRDAFNPSLRGTE